MFLTTTELFVGQLNCSIFDGNTYCFAFPEDIIFGEILNSFQFWWTNSCIANPDYKTEDMLKAVIHALASSESNESSFHGVLIFLVCDDTPWNSTSIRGHSNMSTLIRIPAGHMRFVPSHRQSEDVTAILSPAKWLVELVLISNAASRERYLDQSRIYGVLAHAI
jgi:hypothetical protein